MRKKFANSLGFVLKLVALAAVLGILLLSLSFEYYALREVSAMVYQIFNTGTDEEKLLETALKALDMVLLGVIFFTIATSLFELFIHRISNLPKWLIITDLDDLKALMIKMIIMVMSISFTGKVITWKGDDSILYLGGGMALVITALSYFLLVKNKDGNG